MNPQFIAKPPQPVQWSSLPKRLARPFRRIGFILWQIVVPFNSRPEEIDPFPDPDADIQPLLNARRTMPMDIRSGRGEARSARTEGAIDFRADDISCSFSGFDFRFHHKQGHDFERV